MKILIKMYEYNMKILTNLNNDDKIFLIIELDYKIIWKLNKKIRIQ